MELKNKSTEDKIEAIKQYLNDENNEDISLSLNLFNLLKYGNNWDESFFQHEEILFNSILEFIQIKNAVKPQLDIFCNKLLNIYYNCIYNCSKIVTEEEVQPIPVIYRNILLQGDFLFMSNLANDYKFTSFKEVVYDDPLSVLVPMSNKLGLLYTMLSTNLDIFEKSTE